jgi:general secretion pathway protein D
MKLLQVLVYSSLLLISACSGTKHGDTQAFQPSDKHIHATNAAATNNDIPQSDKRVIPLPPPKPTAKVETYTVTVTNVPAQEILFALARDAKINLDIAPGMQGTVTVNAINQTLPQILDRIAKQVDMRYELSNGTLMVMPDKHYLKTYKIDFINMKRTVKNAMLTSSRIGGSSTTPSAAGGNAASTDIQSETKNDLMSSLIENVTNILIDEDKLHYQEQIDLQTQQQMQARGMGAASNSISLSPQTRNNGVEINQASNGGQVNSGSRAGSSSSGSGNQDIQSEGQAVAKKGVYEKAVNVFANRETGVLIVRATSRQHEKIQEFIDKVMNSARRQVLIEATVAEVTLSEGHQQGIDWTFSKDAGSVQQLGSAGLNSTNTGSMMVLKYIDPNSQLGNISSHISLLESFGKVKVLSSPKLSVMNNQTATLKVVDSRIYFEVNASTTQTQTTSNTVYTTTPHSVDVGFVMNVTPYISDVDTVTMNVRPTISRITGFITDPNPSLAAAGVVNRVPEIQSREMESIIKIDSGQIAILGGLMQDGIDNRSDGVPLLSRIPFLGNFFKNRNDTKTKTELVIFLRPLVIKEASIDGDYSQFRDSLPNADFFNAESSKQTSQEKKAP